jgi:heavy metal translocating P-type ATPase
MQPPDAGPACAHCGLPLGRGAVTATVAGQRQRFCCTGCVLALQVTRSRGEHGAAAALLVRLGLAMFFTMNVMMVSMPSYVPFLYGGTGTPTDGPLFLLMRVLALLLTAPVIGLLGWPIARAGWDALRGGMASADLLIVVATLAAYALSVWNTVAGRAEVYADTACMLLVLVTVGRWLEARARAEAGAAVRAKLAPAPQVAVRVHDGEGRQRVDVATLVAGDVVEVGPGDLLPTDGVVTEGTAGIDESALTGEHVPVPKGPGDAVAGGTCNLDGRLRVRVTSPASASAAARLAALVTEAARTRTAGQRVADRVAGVLVPLVMVVALGAGCVWGVRDGAARGVLVALAVLVVACPCALGIATPMAVWVGVAAAARRGVVVRSAPVLERLAAVRRVLLDKTGTLTARRLRLVAIEPAPDSGLDDCQLLARAAGLEAGLSHPLARAVTDAALARGLAVPDASDLLVLPGRGVRGRIGGQPHVIGSPRFVATELGRLVAVAGGAGTPLVMLCAGRVLGTLRVTESLEPTAAEAVAALRRLGLEVGVLTGDERTDVVLPLLEPREAALGGLLPEDKLAHVQAGHVAGVMMVGDGLNDAPALAAADVGVAVSGATDLTRITADVALMRRDLRALAWGVAHARRVVRVMRQNLAWAFAYNAVAVGVAALGLLNPLVAALAMIGSSVAVVANARRLDSSVRAPGRVTAERAGTDPMHTEGRIAVCP